MASCSSKRRLPVEKNSPPPVKKSRQKKESTAVPQDEAPVSPSLLKRPAGRPKGTTNQGKRRAASPAVTTPPKTPSKTSTTRVGRGKKQVEQQKTTLTERLPPPNSTETLRGKILDILHKSDKDEEAIPDVQQDLVHIDSDDEVDENRPPLHQQETMQGRRAYTENPNLQTYEQEEEGDEDSAMDLSVLSTKLRQSLQDTSVFDDPSKSNVDWWKEDPTREITLVKLWKEEDSLYDFSKKGHMSEDRQAILKRFSTILQVPPHVIDTKMQSMRNMYQSLFRQCKSGSEPEGRTDRQKEVLRLLFFLRQHIKTSASLTSYKGVSPAKGQLMRGKSMLKSTPKPKGHKQVQQSSSEGDVEDELNLSDVVDKSLTPMKPPRPISPFDDSASEDDFVPSTKHFSRNDRLRDPRYSQIAAKRTQDESTHETERKGKAISLKGKALPTKSSSCADSKKLNSDTEKTSVPCTKRQIRVKAQVHANADGTQPILKQKSSGVNIGLKKFSTAEERAAAYNELKAQDLAEKENKTKTKTTAAQRRLLMSSSVNDKDHSKEYDTAIDAAWFDKQGPGYRKQVENERKKKEKDRDEKFALLMAEKNENLKKLTEGLTAGPSASASAGIEVCPEQLWADSMVPKLKRMPEDVRDDFMVHVLSLSVKAIRGKWP